MTQKARTTTDRSMEHAIQRSLAALTIGVLTATGAREARQSQLRLSELELQFQERIAGKAGPSVDTQPLSLSFDTPFYFSPGTRDSDLDVPQFSYGAHLESGTGVIINAHVTAWIRDEENDAVNGVNVEIGVVSPGAEDLIDYTAVLHLTFEGYSALLEDESEMV